MNGFDEKGRPMRVAGKVPTRDGTLIFPGNQGGTNWYSPSYSSRTGLFYIPTWGDYSSIYVKNDQEYEEGRNYGGGRPRSPVNLARPPLNTRKDGEGFGAIRAMDPQTGERKWEFKMADVTDAGILTTDSDLLFSGGREGFFYALDARKGDLLWKTTLGGPIQSGPIAYSVNGREFVSVNAGSSLFVFALRP